MRLYDGTSVGLFGGSFNPAHAGHLHVAMAGLNQLDLDFIWWMVSPQNPLKPAQPPYEQRVATVEALNLNARMHITHFESEFGVNYTVDSIRIAKQRAPKTRFVFLMGADNFLQLPRWRQWRTIIEEIPIAVIARPGEGLRPRLGHAARLYAECRVPENQAHILHQLPSPCWTYLTLPLNPLSSTAIRKSVATG